MSLPPIRKDFEGLLADTRERLTIVERRLNRSQSLRVNQAVLSPSYQGPGPATVILPDGTEVSDVPWLTPYQPGGSSVVELTPQGDQIMILGQTGDPMAGAWTSFELNGTYMSMYGPDTGHVGTWGGMDLRPRVTRTSDGIVACEGLGRMYAASALPIGTLIARLPVGFRPDTRMPFAVQVNDATMAVDVDVDGAIRMKSAIPAGAYVSFNGITFPAAGVAAWEEVGPGSDTTFANGWGPHTDATYGPVRFWKDTYGVVWWTGLIAGGTLGDDVAVVRAGSLARADSLRAPSGFQQTIATTNSSVFGTVGSTYNAANMDILSVKAGNVNNNWIALGGVTVQTPDSIAALTWHIPKMLRGGWVRNSTVQSQLRMTRRCDGLCMSMGLLAGGNYGVAVQAALDSMMPAKRIILGSMAMSARARIDIYGRYDWDVTGPNPAGSIIAQQGPAGWLSFDNLKWVAG